MSIELTDKKFGKRYLTSFKHLVVQEVEQEGSIGMVCAHHGIDKSVVRSWLLLYGSPEYLSKRVERRNLSDRNRIAREIISGKLSITEAQLKYSIKSASAVYKLIREYKSGHQDLLTLLPAVVPSLSVLDNNSSLELAELKIRALEMMLDIASSEFQVDIRKKFGAKQ